MWVSNLTCLLCSVLNVAGALTHFHEDEENQPDGKPEAVELSDEELEELINQILSDDDMNNDGYIDYYEFSQSQKDSNL